MRRTLFALVFGMLVGCNALTPATPTLSPTPATCLGFAADGDLVCVEAGENSAVMQAELSEEITVHSEDVTITVRGTIYISRSDEALIISSLEGSSVVSLTGQGYTRVLQAGSQLRLPIVDGAVQSVETAPEPIAEAELDLPPDPFAVLPRPIETPVPAPSSTEATPDSTENAAIIDVPEITPSTTIHATSGALCEPRPDWVLTYTVEAGDVLELIAREFGTTVLELAQANCLENPGRLSIGQALYVPGDPPTATPSAIAFRADSTMLAPGECTVLRWDVFNVHAVYIGEEETASSDVLRVCPEETTTYNLRVVYPDDTDTVRSVTITVEEP